MALLGQKKKRAEDADNPGAKYLSTVYGLSKSARAWRFTTLIFGVTMLVVLGMYISALRSMPVRLVPYDYAINKGIADVGELGDVGSRYLSRIAIADISLLNNWTSGTIEVQYRRFLNRCAPPLYAKEQVKLINQAKELGGGIRSRAFFPRSTKVIAGQTVEVAGRLRRYEGQEKIEDELVRFRVKYQLLHGVPYIYSISQEPYR